MITIKSLGLVVLATTSVMGQTITVDTLLAPSNAPAGSWTINELAGGGTATLVSLADSGGSLFSNQPGPDGAVRLTTGFSNTDKAAIVLYQDFGDASTVLDDLVIGYSYYKETVDGGNIFAAPALRIGIEYDGGSGDNLGYLVYEPYWNQPGGGAPAVPADSWQTVSVNSETGGDNLPGNNVNGGWWWDGGFEIANSFGGLPLHALEDWGDELMTADPTDFANARVISIGLSVGSYNQGQIGYVDGISFSLLGGATTTYQFSAVPEPGHASLLCGLAGWFAVSWRRRKRSTLRPKD